MGKKEEAAKRALARNPNQKKDFHTKRQKVGKKKRAPTNQTNTLVKAKPITLKEQALHSESNEITTHRNLSFNDLISQTHHYNINFRKEALIGLKEMISLHPAVARSNLSIIVDRLLKLFSDADATVRKMMHNLTDVVFDCIDARQLSPFMPLIVAHLCSALTHLGPRIRFDTLPLLNRLVKSYPELMSREEHWASILPCFTELLTLSTKEGSTAVRAAMTGKVLQSLTLLFDVANLSTSTSTNVSSSSKTILSLNNNNNNNNNENSIVQCAQQPINTASLQPIPLIKPIESTTTTTTTSTTNVVSSSSSKSIISTKQNEKNSNSSVFKLIEILMPMLLHCWLECGPGELRPSSDDLSAMKRVLGTMLGAFRMLQRIDSQEMATSGATGSDAADSDAAHAAAIDLFSSGGVDSSDGVQWPRSSAQLSARLQAAFGSDMERYVCAHFPLIGADSDDRFDVARCDDARLAINVAVCTLMTVFLPSTKPLSWLGDVQQYVSAALSRRAPAARAALLAPLLGVVETMLATLPASSPHRLPLLQAFVTYVEALPVTSSNKRHSVALLARRLAHLDARSSPLERQQWTKCILLLPRLLWQLKNRHLSTTDLCLQTLLRYVQRFGVLEADSKPVDVQQRKQKSKRKKKKAKKNGGDEVTRRIAQSMVPFFYTRRIDTGAPIFGPFVTLPTRSQRLSLDLLFYLLPVGVVALTDAVATCFTPSAAPPQLPTRATLGYFLALLEMQRSDAFDTSKLLMSLLQGQRSTDSSSPSLELQFLQRISRRVDICRFLCKTSTKNDVAQQSFWTFVNNGLQFESSTAATTTTMTKNDDTSIDNAECSLLLLTAMCAEHREQDILDNVSDKQRIAHAVDTILRSELSLADQLQLLRMLQPLLNVSVDDNDNDVWVLTLLSCARRAISHHNSNGASINTATARAIQSVFVLCRHWLDTDDAQQHVWLPDTVIPAIRELISTFGADAQSLNEFVPIL